MHPWIYTSTTKSVSYYKIWTGLKWPGQQHSASQTSVQIVLSVFKILSRLIELGPECQVGRVGTFGTIPLVPNYLKEPNTIWTQVCSTQSQLPQ